jgi:pilus assembly protein CpaB
MRMVFVLVLLAGVGLAGFAVYMAQGYISQTQAALERERAARAQAVPTETVFVVTESLGFGGLVTRENVRAIPWPKDALPEGAFTDIAQLFPEDASLPRTVIRPMEKFEPVLAVKVTAPGEDAGLTTRLGRGMRAFAIKVDVASGVSGFLRPEDRVDVYWTGSNDISGGELTRLIESGIRIIAVDQTADTERGQGAIIARTVTVEANPQQVAKLAQAQATGRLALSLVGIGDDSTVSSVEVDRDALLGIERQEVVEAEQERVCTIKTRRGADVVEIPIPCTN